MVVSGSLKASGKKLFHCCLDFPLRGEVLNGSD